MNVAIHKPFTGTGSGQIPPIQDTGTLLLSWYKDKNKPTGQKGETMKDPPKQKQRSSAGTPGRRSVTDNGRLSYSNHMIAQGAPDIPQEGANLLARKFYSNKSERKQSPRQFLHSQIRDMDSYLQEMVRSVPHTPTTQAMFDEYNDILNRWRRLEQLRCNDKTFTDIMMRCAFPDAMRLCHIMDAMEVYRGKA